MLYKRILQSVSLLIIALLIGEPVVPALWHIASPSASQHSCVHCDGNRCTRERCTSCKHHRRDHAHPGKPSSTVDETMHDHSKHERAAYPSTSESRNDTASYASCSCRQELPSARFLIIDKLNPVHQSGLFVEVGSRTLSISPFLLIRVLLSEDIFHPPRFSLLLPQ